MNNKGFAITTILYGVMVLFCLLLVSLLGILSSYRKTQERLVEANNGARDVINGKTVTDSSSSSEEPGEPSSSSSSEEPGEPSGSDNDTKYILTVNCNGRGTINGGSQTSYQVGKYEKGTVIDLKELYEDYFCYGSGAKSLGWSVNAGATEILSSITMSNEDVILYPVWGS